MFHWLELAVLLGAVWSAWAIALRLSQRALPEASPEAARRRQQAEQLSQAIEEQARALTRPPDERA